MILFLTLLALASALSSDISLQNKLINSPCIEGYKWKNGTCIDAKADTQQGNVVAVSDNCSTGHILINGKCRDFWAEVYKNAVNVPPICNEDQWRANGICRYKLLDSKNVITVPPNCPPEEEFVNGQCREVWKIHPMNTVTVPPNCPGEQVWVNGQCREIWKSLLNQFKKGTNQQYAPQNMVKVLPNCNSGQRWINGKCQDIWTKIPLQSTNNKELPLCPLGQEYTEGQCRQTIKLKERLANLEWSKLWEKISSQLEHQRFLRTKRQEAEDEVQELPTGTSDGRNVIGVPVQCPPGYKPDALGYCREIFDFN